MYVLLGGVIGQNPIHSIIIYDKNLPLNQTPITILLTITDSKTKTPSFQVGSEDYENIICLGYIRNTDPEEFGFFIYKSDDVNFVHQVNGLGTINTIKTYISFICYFLMKYYEGSAHFIAGYYASKEYRNVLVFISAVDYSFEVEYTTDRHSQFVQLTGSKVARFDSLETDMFMTLLSFCQVGCSRCTDMSTCQACEDGYTLNGTSCEPFTCNAQNCILCSSDESECYQCEEGYRVASGNTATCEAATECTGSIQNCVTCLSATECMKCGPLYHLGALGASCVLNECGPSCNKCTLSRDICSECAAGYLENPSNQNECIPNTQCQSTIPQCYSCSSPTECSQCNDGFALENNNSECN